MADGKLVVTTGVSPLPAAAQGRIVQWDIASWDDTLNQSMSTFVDLGLPRPMLHDYVRKKEFPQEIQFRNENTGKHNISVILNNDNNIRVTYSLKVSSGTPRVERVLSRVVAVDPYNRITIPFTLTDLGSVGRLMRRTNKVRFELKVGVISERVDSRRVVSSPGPTLAKSIGACLESEDLLELSDAVVVDKDEGEHPTHRFLLSVRSPVFRATFRHDMQESRTGRILIDASANAVKQLLKFIYTDEIDDLKEDEDLLIEVFGLGPLYALPRLQALVEMQMKDTFTIDNVAGRLLMAVRHDSPLRKDCLSMIKSNISDIVKTEGWAEISKDATVVASLFSCDENEDGSSDDGRNRAKRQRNS